MRPTIVRSIPRADAEHITRLGECGVATVHEAMGRIGLLEPAIRPIFPGARVAGSAVTVSCAAGDNLMIHAAIAVVQPGDVLVVTTSCRPQPPACSVNCSPSPARPTASPDS